MTPLIGPHQAHRPVYLPCDSKCAEAAAVIIAALQAQDSRLRVEHVGSSAVPGCGGKGVIDLLVAYPDGLLQAAKDALAAVGFQPQQSRDPFPEERPMRVGSIPFDGIVYQIHAHVIAEDSPEARELVWFRDRLRRDPVLRAAYEAEKRRILAEGIVDGVDYSEKKGVFVRTVLAESDA